MNDMWELVFVMKKLRLKRITNDYILQYSNIFNLLYDLLVTCTYERRKNHKEGV